MSTRAEITREVLQQLRTEIDVALIPVGKKFGIEIGGGNGMYGGSTGSLSLKFKVAGVNLEREEWNKYAALYGLKKSWLGKTFMNKGQTYTIIGLRPTRSRFNVATTKSDGTPYFWTSDLVSEAMGKTA